MDEEIKAAEEAGVSCACGRFLFLFRSSLVVTTMAFGRRLTAALFVDC